MVYREPISFRRPEPEPKLIMANRRKTLVNGMIPLPETEPSKPPVVETLNFRPKEPNEKTGRELPFTLHSLKQKTVDLSDKQEKKAPDDPPNIDEIKESTSLLFTTAFF